MRLGKLFVIVTTQCMSDPRQETKDRLDIVDLIMEYLPLKSAGGGSFRTTCPFHAEKTPSFYVSREKQIWHCFGCAAGGDVFTFVMQMEGIAFPDALRLLAEKAGVEVPRYTSDKTNTDHRLIAMHELAVQFYTKILEVSPQAEAARAYVVSRQIPDDLVVSFRLGYAPSDWGALSQFLARRGYTEREMVQAGLAVKKKSGTGVFDRFRERLMIPLCDTQGKCCGFTGRLIGEGKEGLAKYMNSPETPVYHKSEMLFGFHLAKQDARQQKAMVIVEGNIDVIASHKAGVRHVVASSGTALTSQQLARLKRLAPTLVFSFDADAAGFEAARRGIQLARSEGFDVRVAVLPEGSGKDPDDAIRKDPAIWQKAVHEPLPIIDYYIRQAVRGKDLTQVDDKRSVAKLILPELSSIEDVVEREHWLRVVADLLTTDIAVLRTSLQKPTQKPVTTSAPTLAPPSLRTKTPRPTKERQAALTIFGGWIQGLVHPTTFADEVFWTEAVVDADLAMLYKVLKNAYDLGKSNPDAQKSFFLWTRGTIESAHQDLLPLFDEAALLGERTLSPLPPPAASGLIEDLIRALESSYKRTKREHLMARIRAAEAGQSGEEVTRLIREFNAWR